MGALTVRDWAKGDRQVTIRPHIRYLVYLLRHKWYVLIIGRRLHVPLWRLLIHDWSKFTPAEWGPYVSRFFRPRLYGLSSADTIAGRVRDFHCAFLHHVHFNPHHWQHWVPVDDRGELHPLPMPDVYIREMVADWASAGLAKNGELDIAEWYRRERTKMVMDSDTRIVAEGYIEELTGESLWAPMSGQTGSGR